HVLHLRPIGSEVEITSFPLVLSRAQAGLDHTVRFVLGNLMVEANRAQKTEDLAPIIDALVGFLDTALVRYFDIAEAEAANAANLLNPADLSSQVQVLVDSIKQNYPTVAADTEREPLISIVIPVFNKFDLTYACVKSVV